MKITAVLMVKEIEPLLPFWIDRLGFQKTVEIPGFVILQQGGAELMLQTIESVRHDTPQFAPKGDTGNVGLFIEVDNLDTIIEKLAGYPIVLPERTTFYGMREIGVEDPGGQVVIFAAKSDELGSV